MHAYVGKVRSDFPGSPFAAKIMNTECSVVLFEQVVDFLGKPARIAKLEDVTMSWRQGCEKLSQSFVIAGPAWRQLKEYGSQRFS